MFLHMAVVHSFLLLQYIPFKKYTTTHLSMLLLADIWVIFSLGSLECCLCMFFIPVFQGKCTNFSWVFI